MRQILILLFLMLSSIVHAQISVTGSISGKNSKAPLPFSSVMLLNPSDSTLIDGTITTENGSFSILIPKAGYYLIMVRRIGYEDYLSAPLELLKNVDIGQIFMNESVNKLEEVVVTGKRSTVETQLGKRVLNVGEDLSSTGVSVTEALERVPSVSTDIQGNISIRGSSNVIIYVNGKETRRDGRSLQAISASALQKIEVITNPSAKYDAEGVGGIINLVFKKDRTKDFKLDVFSTITRPNRFSFGLNNQVSSQKFTGYLNASINRSKYLTQENQIRTNTNNHISRYENLVSSTGKGRTNRVTTGLTYEPDTTLSINMEFDYWRWLDPETRIQANNFFFQDGTQENLAIRNYSRELEDEISFSLSLDKRWSDEKTLKFLVNAGGEDEVNTAIYNQDGIDLIGTRLDESINSSDETENQRIYQLTLDYTAPFFGFGSLETGGKFDHVKYDISQSLNFVSEELFLPENDFGITLNKYAYYAIHKKKWSKFEYGLGARLEHFGTKAHQNTTGQFNEQSVTRLFPSVQMVYKFSNAHQLAFNYSKRINRPGFFDLNPFVSFTDPLVLSTGNPDLEPEFANAYEVSYQMTSGNFSMDVTGFRRVTTNLIQQTIAQLDDERLLQSYDNFGKRMNSGVELSTVGEVFKILELSGDFSLYHTQFQTNQGDQAIRFNNRSTWQLNARQKLSLSNDWTIELVQNYRAPSIGIQSRDLERYHVNLAIRKSFNNNRAIVTLNIQDIFDTRVFASELKGEDFLVNSSYKFQTRRASLELRYKLFD